MEESERVYTHYFGNGRFGKVCKEVDRYQCYDTPPGYLDYMKCGELFTELQQAIYYLVSRT